MTSPAAPTWGTVLGRLDGGLDLDADSGRWAVEQIMSGQADPEDVKAFLLGVQAKGPTAAEVLAAADVLLEHARPITVLGDVLDVVGTGGDGANTVNFSTMAAIVAAACGATIGGTLSLVWFICGARTFLFDYDVCFDSAMLRLEISRLPGQSGRNRT